MLSLTNLLLIPETLLVFVLQASFAASQTTQLPLGQPVPLSSNNLPTHAAFALPRSSLPLTISIALCSVPAANGPRFFATNNSAINLPGPDGGADVYEVAIGNNGIGNVTLYGLNNGGTFAVDAGSGQQEFEVGVSDSGKYVLSYSRQIHHALFQTRCMSFWLLSRSSETLLLIKASSSPLHFPLLRAHHPPTQIIPCPPQIFRCLHRLRYLQVPISHSSSAPRLPFPYLTLVAVATTAAYPLRHVLCAMGKISKDSFRMRAWTVAWS